MTNKEQRAVFALEVADPTVGVGVPARVGDIGFSNTDPPVFYKFDGGLATNWSTFSSGGGGGGSIAWGGITGTLSDQTDLQIALDLINDNIALKLNETTFDTHQSASNPHGTTAADVGAATTAQGALADSALQPDDSSSLTDLNIKGSLYANAIKDSGNSGAAVTIDFSDTNFRQVTLTEDSTFTLTAPPGPSTLILEIYQGGAGGWTPTFPASVIFTNNNTLPTWSVSSGAVDVVSLFWNGTDYKASLFYKEDL